MSPFYRSGRCIAARQVIESKVFFLWVRMLDSLVSLSRISAETVTLIHNGIGRRILAALMSYDFSSVPYKVKADIYSTLYSLLRCAASHVFEIKYYFKQLAAYLDARFGYDYQNSLIFTETCSPGFEC